MFLWKNVFDCTKEKSRWWIGSEFFATKQPTKIFLTNYCRLFIMSKKNVTLQTLKTNLHPLLRESRIFNLSRTTQCTQIKFVYIHQLDKRSGWLPLVWCQRRGQMQTKHYMSPPTILKKYSKSKGPYGNKEACKVLWNLLLKCRSWA